MSGFSPPPADSSESHYCPECGYDLRGISSPRCPECGLAIDLAAVSPIPWCHRHRIGRRRAFFRTVWLATFHPGKIAAAVAGPVDEKGANLFRWYVIAIAAIPLIAPAITGSILLGLSGNLNIGMYPMSIVNSGSRSALDVPMWEASLMLLEGITLWPVTCIGIVLTLAILTRSISIWFRDSSLSSLQLNRARAVANYASAPLVFLCIPTALAVGITFNDPILALYILCGIFIFAPLFLCWFTALRLLRHATHCGAERILVVGTSLPILWALSVIIGLGVFPASIGLLRIMIQSLR